VISKIEMLGIDGEHRGRIVLIEEARVGFRQPHQVFLRNIVLVGDVAALYPLDQGLRRRLQVDHEIRRRRLRFQMGVDLPVEGELVVVQRETREQGILLDHEIGDRDPGEQVELRQRAHLRRALEQEKELGRQRMARAILVEAGQERVGVGIFQQRQAAGALAQHARERGLAGADRAFDDDVAVLVGQLRGHFRTL
jgi:hypothetical protein